MLVVITVILAVTCFVSSMLGLVFLGYIGVHHNHNPGEYYKPAITVLAVAITSGAGLLAVLVFDRMGAN